MTSCTIRAARYDEIVRVASKLPYPVSPNIRGVTNGYITVLYDGWTPNAVQVHIYSERTKDIFDKMFWKEAFGYAFGQCGKELIYAVTPGDSESSLAVSRALGFKEVYRMRDGWSSGVDMVLKEMRKEDCRWIRSLQ